MQLIAGHDLAVVQRLTVDLSERATSDPELVAHCRFQAALCQVEIGELTAALGGFRSLLADERRRLDELAPELLELRMQIGVLMALHGRRARSAGRARTSSKGCGAATIPRRRSFARSSTACDP